MEMTEPKRSFLYDVLLPKVEAVALILSVLGLALKLSLISSGNTELIIGLSTLSTVYFLRAFAPSKRIGADEVNFPEQYFGKPTNHYAATSSEISFFSDSILPKVIWLGGATAIIGILFKLMIWPGANNQLFVGFGCELIVIIGLALNQRVSLRSIVLGALTGVMLLINPKYLVQQFHRDDPVLVEKMFYHMDHPRDSAAGAAVRQQLNQARHRR
ncbi:MAG: hypothetical protein M3Y54_06810 [Bacteroidota bacterium]|nr:hypothetical protein [Bacteroidota bacterium]